MKNNRKEDYSYEFDQLSMRAIYSPEIFQQLTEFSLYGLGKGSTKKWEDDPVDYVLNSRGFRGPEFGPVNLLAAGCSQTFGIGIRREQNTWPALLANMLDMPYANISRPGISNPTIVHSIFAYIREYGAPEVICVNLPSLYRFKLPTRADINSYPYAGGKYSESSRTATTFPSKSDVHVSDISMTPTGGTEADDVINWPMYDRRPYDITKTIPYEAALYLSMMELNHLIDYCKVANITLLITTWYPDTAKLFSWKIEQMADPDTSDLNTLDLSGYVVFDDLLRHIRDAEKLVGCHTNTDNLDDWHHGLDRPKHMGAHTHLHFAEMLYKKYKEIKG